MFMVDYLMTMEVVVLLFLVVVVVVVLSGASLCPL